MYKRPFFRRSPRQPRERKASRRVGLILLMLLAALGMFSASAFLYLKRISGQIALSDASDIMIQQVNEAIHQVLLEGD